MKKGSKRKFVEPTAITEINSRSKFTPLLSNTSRCPVAEVTQIRSLDGTAYKNSLAEEIDPEEKVVMVN